MIVYLTNKSEFLEDVVSNQIADRILAEFRRTHHKSVGASEINSWTNSMGFMHRILIDAEIPNDSGVAIEFGIPPTGKRIDFILTGRNSGNRQTAVIIELKQWTEARLTNMDATVRTYIGGSEKERPHPSYQAWSYAELLEDNNEAVRDRNMSLKPCAYLHNCISSETIKNPFYKEYTDKAPSFLKADAEKLRAFIKEHVKHGDAGELIYQIRDGKISPSKSLADCLASLLQGKREFLMIDDQKMVYETALKLSKEASSSRKQVLIIEGGPGTGKSVVAINLLVELTNRALVAKYVTKNAAPRAVYESKLTGLYRKSRISNLFTGSGIFTETQENVIDALIVDEAHRLNEKSGLFQNLGDNQIKEIINAAKFSVFFVDERQRVTFKDIGGRAEIRRWAAAHKASITEMALESQFRCNGSDGYPAWVDNTLQTRETANPTMDGVDYEFTVCDSPNDLRKLIIEKNRPRNKARMVAGYCWDWISKNDPKEYDIELQGSEFKARWNLANDGGLWILKPESVNEIGCIHTCQGLELDYIGVILGPDLIVRNGVVQTDATKRSSNDASIKGYKSLLKKSPAQARLKADEIIKNTYRTLMTRAQKGCFVYSVDAETNAFLKASAIGTKQPMPSQQAKPFATLPVRLLNVAEIEPFINSVPVFDLQIAAGKFSEHQSDEDWSWVENWVELPQPLSAKRGFFVTRVIGESMNRRVPNGSWCLFKEDTGGSREGKVVLVEHRDIQDPDNGGHFTIKIYHSEKRATEDSWEHSEIVLKPSSTVLGFSDISLNQDQISELKVRGELVAVLGQK